MEVNQLLEQVKAIGAQADENTRIKIVDALLQTITHLETPIQYLLRLSGCHLQMATARFGVDIGLFRALVASSTPLSLSTLSEQLKVNEVLLSRLVRYMGATGQVQETGVGEYTANHITKILAVDTVESAVHHLFDTHEPTFQDLPNFLQDHKYRNITESTNTVFQKSFKTDQRCYEWLIQHPEPFAHMQKTLENDLGGDWLTAFPIDKETENWSGRSDPERTLFIDVGGGLGQQAIRLREKYPDVPGRVILQDLAETIDLVKKPMPGGVEAQVTNFYEPQTVKGAKYYYMRNVLHGDPDEKCITILKAILPAMDSESVLLIDDLVLPDEGIHWQSSQYDLVMMMSMSALKRTRSQWYSLLDASGYKIVEIRTYTYPLGDSLIFAVPK